MDVKPQLDSMQSGDVKRKIQSDHGYEADTDGVLKKQRCGGRRGCMRCCGVARDHERKPDAVTAATDHIMKTVPLTGPHPKPSLERFHTADELHSFFYQYARSGYM
jgi:hypothetical protein